MTSADNVREIIAEVLDLDESALREHDDITALDGWDSVNQLRILMAIESKIGVKLPLKEFVTCRTVHDIAALSQRVSQSTRT